MNKIVKNLAVTAVFASISGAVVYKVMKSKKDKEEEKSTSSNQKTVENKDDSLKVWDNETCSNRHYKKLKIGK